MHRDGLPRTSFKEVFAAAASPFRVGQQRANLPEVILFIVQAAFEDEGWGER